jgi:hypothetical protein
MLQAAVVFWARQGCKLTLCCSIANRLTCTADETSNGGTWQGALQSVPPLMTGTPARSVISTRSACAPGRTCSTCKPRCAAHGN